MKKVGDMILSNIKSPLYVSVLPDQRVIEVIQMMAAQNVEIAVVLDGRRLVGIFSERDLIRKIILRHRKMDQVLVKEVMTIDIVYVSSEKTLEETLSCMDQHGVKQLPILDGEDFMGIISVLEVVKLVLQERESVIHRLEKYVSETWPL